MNDLRYVVTGLPRSGTKYISKVLSELGLNCGHEEHFGTVQATLVRPDEAWDGIWGDASWMAVPYLEHVFPGTVVLHQVRDPIKVLNSNLPPGGDSYFRTWDEHAGRASDPLYNKPLPYKRFIWDNTRDWVWPTGGGAEPEGHAEIQRLVHWWMNWNNWVECAALRRIDVKYIRYRIEDINPKNWTLLRDIIKVIDPAANTKEQDEVQSVLEKVSITTNRHRAPSTKITVKMLPPTAQLMMYRYGYDPTKVPAV
jgi:hypothetical protein